MSVSCRSWPVRRRSAASIAGALALALGVLGCSASGGQPAGRVTATAAAARPATDDPLRSFRTSAQPTPLPSFTSDLGIALDRGSAVRLRVRSDAGQHGLWLAVSSATQPHDAAVRSGDDQLVCLRVVPLAGDGQGEGGLTCESQQRFRRTQRMLLVLLERVEDTALAPRPTNLVAGIVPGDVRSVRLTTHDGATSRQATPQRAFLFVTDRDVATLRYTTRGRSVTRPLASSVAAAPRP